MVGLVYAHHVGLLRIEAVPGAIPAIETYRPVAQFLWQIDLKLADHVEPHFAAVHRRHLADQLRFHIGGALGLRAVGAGGILHVDESPVLPQLELLVIIVQVGWPPHQRDDVFRISRDEASGILFRPVNITAVKVLEHAAHGELVIEIHLVCHFNLQFHGIEITEVLPGPHIGYVCTHPHIHGQLLFRLVAPYFQWRMESRCDVVRPDL